MSVRPVSPQPESYFGSALTAATGKLNKLNPFASKIQPVVAPAQKSLVQKIATFISNVFAAIRTCLSYIPLVGRVFARPVAPVVVKEKPSVPALMANAVKGALATSAKFAVDHKVAVGATVVVGTAAYFGGQKVVDFVKPHLPSMPDFSSWFASKSETPTGKPETPTGKPETSTGT